MRFDEDYENYEPDIAIWPYVLLTILLPLIPFVGNIFLFPDSSSMGLFWNIIGYVIAALPLLASAMITRTAEGRGILLINAVIYFFAVIGKWAELSVSGAEGFALGIPIVTAFAPAFLPVMAYVFYSKRKRMHGWGLFELITLLSELFFIFYLYWSKSTLWVYMAFPVLITLMAVMMLFVSRRSEGAPWYINIVLTILVFLSLLVTKEGPAMLSMLSQNGGSGIRVFLMYVLETIATDYLLWFTVSCCLSFAALGMKSCYAELDVSSVLSDEEGSEDTVLPERETPHAVPPLREEIRRPEPQDRGYDLDEPVGKYYHGRKEVNRDYRPEERPRYPEEEYRRESSRGYYEEPRRYQERDYYDDPRRYPEDRRYPEEYSGRPRREEYPPRYDEDRRRPYYPEDDGYRRSDDRRPRYDDRRYVEDDYYAPRQKRDSYRGRRYGDEFRDSEERNKDKWYQLLKGEIPEEEFKSRK